MSIVKECMTANLQIGVWMGYRLDKEASRNVTEQANANPDAARVNKHLVPKEALKPIVSAASAMRAHFYDKTLPWKDNGDRLLTRQLYMSFIEEHSRLRDAFHGTVKEFLYQTYPAARERSEFRMGDLFKDDDYPSVSALRSKFYINLDIDAVTEAGDFRVALDQDTLTNVRSDMEQAMQQRIGRAMGDVWARLSTTLEHFAAKMSSDEVFRDATVRNLEEIVELLPALNILNDPELERIRADIAASLVGYAPKDLRGDKAVRSVVAGEAQRIMGDMRGFMNAFTGVAA